MKINIIFKKKQKRKEKNSKYVFELEDEVFWPQK
jgi:hypothetical protein